MESLVKLENLVKAIKKNTSGRWSYAGSSGTFIYHDNLDLFFDKITTNSLPKFIEELTNLITTGQMSQGSYGLITAQLYSSIDDISALRSYRKNVKYTDLSKLYTKDHLSLTEIALLSEIFVQDKEQDIENTSPRDKLIGLNKQYWANARKLKIVDHAYKICDSYDNANKRTIDALGPLVTRGHIDFSKKGEAKKKVEDAKLEIRHCQSVKTFAVAKHKELVQKREILRTKIYELAQGLLGEKVVKEIKDILEKDNAELFDEVNMKNILSQLQPKDKWYYLTTFIV